MARMFPANCPATKSGNPVAPEERHLFARLARELEPGWQIIHDCEVRSGGESGTVEFVLLHRDYGIALLGVATPGVAEDPEIAVAAMRAMLEEIGFARRYPGHLAVVARYVVPAAVSDLAAFLAVRFAALPASAIADPTWPDWLLQRLIPERLVPASASQNTGSMLSASAERGLRAPTPEDSWRVADKPPGAASQDRRPKQAAAQPPDMPVVAERIAVSRDVEARSPLWTGMALAVIVVAVVLVGIAVLSHGNGPGEMLARQSPAPPVPASGASN